MPHPPHYNSKEENMARKSGGTYQPIHGRRKVYCNHPDKKPCIYLDIPEEMKKPIEERHPLHGGKVTCKHEANQIHAWDRSYPGDPCRINAANCCPHFDDGEEKKKDKFYLMNWCWDFIKGYFTKGWGHGARM